ncbi:MAG: MOSC domain-containing protein [Pseudomonadota bacterium]
MIPLAELTARHAQDGQVAAILIRPERLAPPERVTEAWLAEAGLDGDHARPGKRALTMIQAEHLPVVAALSGRADVAPEVLRRNLVISGINLGALRGQRVRIGPEAEVEITGPCAPCSRMETALGQGGYTALRGGHGGWCARVIAPGPIKHGDSVAPTPGR